MNWSPKLPAAASHKPHFDSLHIDAMKNYSVLVAELAKEKVRKCSIQIQGYATARSLYSHAMSFDRSNHNYSLNRSFANLKLARWDEAEADATKTLDLSPRNLKALYRRGLARKELGKWDQARADIHTFIDNGGTPTLGAQELRSIADAESLPPPGPPQPSSHTSSDLESALSNVLLQDDSSLFTIHTSATVPEGKGAFASRDIQRGDLILSEKPIFSIRGDVPDPLKAISIESAVIKLSPFHLDEFLSLQNSHTECQCNPNHPLVGIYSTNGFGLGIDGSSEGVCLKASRFNHSCSPNARFSFNSNTGEIRIYALGTIPSGEEIFITYISDFVGRRCLYGTPRRLRQAALRDAYHFTCACSACSLTEAESKKSDARRVKLNELREIIQNFTQSRLEATQLLRMVVEGVRLLKEEGYLADADDFTTYGGRFCALYSDWVSAKYWAGLAYHTRVAEFGEDSPRTANVRGEYLDPRSFPYAGRGPLKKFTAIRLTV
ncbi:hypothetical protein EI94DRAFT_1750632 [Lactarius quietus]|nr:hypothetical protein EI94DRAFT_1750632 [Lactarius quietus]